jgi:hypothetical protein
MCAGALLRDAEDQAEQHPDRKPESRQLATALAGDEV